MGLVERKVGSGTYIRSAARVAPPLDPAEGRLFGLLIPGLGDTEIFEPICGQIARDLQRHKHTLLWEDFGGTVDEGLARRADELCESYIARRVAGVFFAPLESAPEKDAANRRIVQALDAAGIPIVLLDRDVVAYPDRSRFDLVAIDNRRAGHVLAAHLLSTGVRRIDFVARPHSAPTVLMRIAGCQDALRAAGIEPHPEWVHLGDPADLEFVRPLAEDAEVAAVMCANDVTAGHLMHNLDRLGRRVPEDVRVAGFDDVTYAKLLRAPLTTLRQPCHDLGSAAASAMLERIARPEQPARDVLLDARMVVRSSCGAVQASEV